MAAGAMLSDPGDVPAKQKPQGAMGRSCSPRDGLALSLSPAQILGHNTLTHLAPRRHTKRQSHPANVIVH